MTTKQVLGFVEKSGIALESARGPVPSLAQTIAGEAIRGSWWAHPKGKTIFACSRAIRSSKDVLTCRLIEGKVTYVHRRLWPALARLSERFAPARIAAIREVHSASGAHRIEVVPFPAWVPSDEMRKGANLSIEQATSLLESAGIGKFK
ncbi:MAG TPA: hypothetical protein VNP98_08090 [Chthoniobacterales bacterium]|nr:hypothetical protein [Chthoniobacterales bacterium]